MRRYHQLHITRKLCITLSNKVSVKRIRLTYNYLQLSSVGYRSNCHLIWTMSNCNKDQGKIIIQCNRLSSWTLAKYIGYIGTLYEDQSDIVIFSKYQIVFVALQSVCNKYQRDIPYFMFIRLSLWTLTKCTSQLRIRMTS